MAWVRVVSKLEITPWSSSRIAKLDGAEHRQILSPGIRPNSCPGAMATVCKDRLMRVNRPNRSASSSRVGTSTSHSRRQGTTLSASAKPKPVPPGRYFRISGV